MSKDRKNSFASVTPKVDFVALEKKNLEYWYKSGVVKKYLEKNKKSKKRFSFLDGPITANGLMGVHHGWGRTYKDLWQRFFNMSGFEQRFQNGFDCQGLWVEVEVEKELGLKNKKDIENLVKGDAFASIAKFVELCKKRVIKYSKIQTEQSKRLGYFMDWDNSYYTMSEENNYMIWHFLKKCYEKGLIYKGLDSVPWCPRCGTAISQHEILTEEYKEITHKSVFVKYPIMGRRREYLLVWTTTPWTLPANVAIAVGKDIIYSRVKKNGQILYLAKDLLMKVMGNDVEVLDELTGINLIGLRYEGPYDHLPAAIFARSQNPRTFHTVIDGGKLVTSSEGTGLVHIAPGAGHEDYELAKTENLPIILAIDEEGSYLSEFGEFSGKNAALNPRIILDDLSKRGWLQKIEDYIHRYPVCWRCRSELLFRAVDEWYISMSPVRRSMIDVAKRIRWIPAWGLDREIDWLANMSDWLISKKRYWGLALPIWECQKCGNFEIIGSKEELSRRAVEGWKDFSGHTPHRPWVDLVKISCSKCGELARRIPDVGNPWLDAGIVPFSTLIDPKDGKVSYLSDKKYWEKWYPADFITEGFAGQFKNWFYSLIAMSTVLENREPFRTVLGHGTVLGEDGRQMHKSWGNAIEFNEAADKIGVDVMRWLYLSHNPADDLLFGYKKADEVRRRFHLILWNVYNFFITYALADNWGPRKRPASKNILDKWIKIRFIQTTEDVKNNLFNFDAYSATSQIESFVQDLSLWYIRRSRDRVGPLSPDSSDKEDFYQTCYFVLVNFCKILAPFNPFIADEIYRNLTASVSVHLEDWPQYQPISKKDLKIVEEMKQVREIVEAGRRLRKSNNIPVRQPLRSIKIAGPYKKFSRQYIQLIKDELNVKDVLFSRGKKLDIKLDTRISEELLQERKARELAREISEIRKEMGLGVKDQVDIVCDWLPKDKKLFEWLKKKTFSRQLIKGDKLVVRRI